MSRLLVATIEFELPPDANLDDAKDYILDAVGTMKGCYRPAGGYGPDDPGHPMQPLDHETVQLRKIGYGRRRKVGRD